MCLLLPGVVAAERRPAATAIRLGCADSGSAMLRIQGDRASLLAALTAQWADQQLQIPQPLRPVSHPIRRSPRPLR
mgnify:CR=1 FL=1